MDKPYIVPSTLSFKGRVSFSRHALPQALQYAALDLLEDCLTGCRLSDADLMAFLTEVSKHYQPGMSQQAFLLRARAGICGWAQRYLAAALQQDESARQLIRDTLCRCIPAFLVTDSLVTRCERSKRRPTAENLDIDPIIQFAAQVMLESPEGKHPLWARLHASAHRLLPDLPVVTRDDLRLAVLDALCLSDELETLPVPEFLKLRLGREGRAPLSIEAIAAQAQLPPVYLRELEEGLLQTLIRTAETEERHA